LKSIGVCAMLESKYADDVLGPPADRAPGLRYAPPGQVACDVTWVLGAGLAGLADVGLYCGELDCVRIT
jgi:hypothetical protein